MSIKAILQECAGFEWDEYNVHKNWDKHQVSWWECEEIFSNDPLLLAEDTNHSEKEQRYFALGKTDESRNLFISFTVRNKNIRIISARDMSKKERTIYVKSET
jgi:uncharacterized DUF497 family protein